MAEKSPVNLLLADSDTVAVNQLKNSLQGHNFTVHVAANSDQAVDIIYENAIDICLLQFMLEPYNACVLSQVIEEQATSPEAVPGIIISVSNQVTGRDQAVLQDLGHTLLLQKPLRLPVFLGMVEKAVQRRRQQLATLKLKNTVIDPLIVQGKAEEAIDLIRKHLMGGSPEAQILGLEILRSMNQDKLVIDMAKQMHGDEPSDTRILTEMARAYMSKRDYGKAMALFEKADQQSPGNISRKSEMADCYLKMDHQDKWIETYDELVKLLHRDRHLTFSLYEKIIRAGQPALAEDFCRRNAKPAEIVAHFCHLGVALAGQGLQEQSRAAFREGHRIVTDKKSKQQLLLKAGEVLKDAAG